MTLEATDGGSKFLLLSTFLLLVATVVGGCESFQEGPSLRNLVVVDRKTPTGQGPQFCCCRITGSVTNRNDVAVHVTITWAAFKSVTELEPFARILHFVNDVQPGQTVPFVTPDNGPGASGFLVSCNTIVDLRREVEVRGIFLP